MMHRNSGIFLVIFSCLSVLRAAPPAAYSGRYALILSDPSAAEFAQAHRNAPQAVENHRQQIRDAQSALRTQLANRRYTVTGSVQTVLNAVFVIATPAQVAELRSLPGVKAVRPLRRFHLNLDRAVIVINANPKGWDLVGGPANAGKGLKIAMIDTGIDITHPAFQDPSLPVPAGFPKCDVPSDCVNFTNSKVIVARSYIKQVAAGSGTPATTTPDDYSARDRDGHGTSTSMCAAGETNSGPVATITGVAPKAYLGNYKVFGDPEVNGTTTGDVIIQALEDALNDGMDVASLSLGSTAFSGALDTGATCGAPAGSPCDPEAYAVENAIQSGMLVVAAAGNDGANGDLTTSDGTTVTTLNTIESPGDAPSAISVAGNQNGHTWTSAVLVTGSNVPSTIQNIQAQASLDGPQPGRATAPLFDVGPITGDPLGCNTIPGGALSGDLALIERGTCDFSTKVFNAQAAGAVGVIVYDTSSSTPIAPEGLFGTAIPMAFIAEPGASALQSFVDANPGYPATLESVAVGQDSEVMAYFSSRGPTIDGMMKPDVTAVGTDLYMAAERFNPDGDLYGPDGYTISQGTSFATPQVTGTAALVKQMHPNFTPAELKSALVNTAVGNVLTETAFTGPQAGASVPAFLISQGAGLLDVAAALSSTVAVAPAAVSFGYLGTSAFPPAGQQLQITNTGSSTVNLTLAVKQLTTDANAKVSLSSSSVSLDAGQSTTVTASLGGTLPAPGSYQGFITITGGAETLQVSYLYTLGDGVPYNTTPVLSISDFDCTVGQTLPDGGIAFQLIDQYGVPISGTPISWNVNTGGGSISSNLTDSATEAIPGTPGLGFATATCGPEPGPQEFQALVADMQVLFDGTARLNPTIAPNGAVNAASFQVGNGVAPGSYLTLFGTGLSDTTDSFTTPYLPLAIDYASVSFDVPSAGLSLPGLISYVSPGQVNLQVPWELQGQSSVIIKVTIEDSQGSLYTLPLAQYSPAFFDYLEPVTNDLLLIAYDASGDLIGSSHPATPGQTVQLYANGLGPVNNQPADGQVTPVSPPAATTTTPTVTIGGQAAPVQFSGLAPNLIGVYVLTVQVPAGISSGMQPVIVSINGVASPPSTLPVQ